MITQKVLFVGPVSVIHPISQIESISLNMGTDPSFRNDHSDNDHVLPAEDPHGIKINIFHEFTDVRFNVNHHAYRGLSGYVICFDLTDNLSEGSLQREIENIKISHDRYASGEFVAILVGCRSRYKKENQATQTQLQALAKKYNMPYIEAALYINADFENVCSTMSKHIIDSAKKLEQISLTRIDRYEKSTSGIFNLFQPSSEEIKILDEYVRKTKIYFKKNLAYHAKDFIENILELIEKAKAQYLIDHFMISKIIPESPLAETLSGILTELAENSEKIQNDLDFILTRRKQTILPTASSSTSYFVPPLPTIASRTIPPVTPQQPTAVQTPITPTRNRNQLSAEVITFRENRLATISNIDCLKRVPEARLENLTCSVSLGIPNIPVMIGTSEHLYDLMSLLRLPENLNGARVYPVPVVDRKEFYLDEIRPSRFAQKMLDDLAKEFPAQNTKQVDSLKK